MPHMGVAKGHVMLKDWGWRGTVQGRWGGKSRGGGQSRMAYDSIGAGTPWRSG